jgi:cellobiose phosphorylase
MASIRSASTSKPPERLSNRHLNRTATSITPIAQKKITINKPTKHTTSTSRQKSSVMSLKKGFIGSATSLAEPHSYTKASPTNSVDMTTDHIASIKLQDVSTSRSRSRISDATHNSLSQINSNEEQQNGQSESSFSNNQYTLESFDTVRTVGTGKIFSKQKFQIDYFFVLF